MSTSSSLPVFGPSCPSGGKWYACSSGSNFVGCCGTDPCSLNCAQGSLYPASFNPSYHEKFSDASCPSGSNFYTCTGTNPVFMGCCKTNPCQAGRCAGDALVPAFLGSDFLKSQYGAVAGGSSSSLSSARPSSTASAVGPASVARVSTLATITSSTASSPTDTSASQASPLAVQQKEGPPVAAIAGGAAGGAFALAVVIGLLIYYCCHAKKSRRGHEETVVRRESDLAAMAAMNVNVQGKGNGFDAPPSYRSPNPNDYYGAQGHADAGRYHQYIPEPQEMPCDTQNVGVAGFSGKPVSHQRNLSELSGETAMISEMDSPHVATSPSEPHTSWQGSPGGYTGSNWTPQQTWQTQSPTQMGESQVHGHPQGLGLNGNDMNPRTTTH